MEASQPKELGANVALDLNRVLAAQSRRRIGDRLPTTRSNKFATLQRKCVPRNRPRELERRGIGECLNAQSQWRFGDIEGVGILQNRECPRSRAQRPETSVNPTHRADKLRAGRVR